MVAVEADGGVGPLSTDRVTAENGQPEVSEEGDRRFEVADGDADVLELDRHAQHATKSGRRVQTANDLPILEPVPVTDPLAVMVESVFVGGPSVGSLPEDVPSSVELRWRSGEHQAALTS